MNKRLYKRIDTNYLVGLMAKAVKLEIQSAYKYHLMSINTVGHEANAISDMFEEHSEEELEHAKLLTKRMNELGGCVDINWENDDALKGLEDYCSTKSLDAAMKMESDSIDIYHEIILYVENKDHVTYDIVVDILKKECEHERETQNFLDDIEKIKGK